MSESKVYEYDTTVTGEAGYPSIGAQRQQRSDGHAKRTVVGALAVLGIAGAALVASVQPASATSGYSDLGISDAEWSECVASYGVQCQQAKSSAEWAEQVTAWRFGVNGHNDVSDAFRHCAWMGSLATRVGETRAEDIGFLHERHTPNPYSEWAMDVLNNQVGAYYGQLAVDMQLSDQWGYVISVCESEARSGNLYGADGVQGAY